MVHIFLYISANFLLFFKGPWPFKSQKMHFSGLTTQYAPRLNQGPSAAKKHDSGWVIAWIFLDSGSRGVPRGDAQDARASPLPPLCIPPPGYVHPPLPSLKGWL
jgi:hypothetical protein